MGGDACHNLFVRVFLTAVNRSKLLHYEDDVMQKSVQDFKEHYRKVIKMTKANSL